VIAATALLSAINALTLKPTQSALWLRPPVPPERRNAFYRGFNSVYARLERGYAGLYRPHGEAQRPDGGHRLGHHRGRRMGVGAGADRLSTDRGPRLSHRGRSAAGRRRAGPAPSRRSIRSRQSPAKTRASIKS